MYRKQREQVQRIIMYLCLAHLPLTNLDFQPDWDSVHAHTRFCVQGAIFQGCRFTIAAYEIMVLCTSFYALRNERRLPFSYELTGHIICWLVGGLGVAVASGLTCEDNPANGFDNIDPLVPDALTYTWMALVGVSLVGCLIIECEVWRQRRAPVGAKPDPYLDTRIIRLRRERLTALRADVLATTVRPLRWYPVIFAGTALGEIGLLVIRSHGDALPPGTALAIVYACNCLIDVRGALNALVYFGDAEARQQVKLPALRKQWAARRRIALRRRQGVDQQVRFTPLKASDASANARQADASTPLLMTP